MKSNSGFLKKTLRTTLIRALVYIGCHMLSIVIKHKELDNTYKEDMDDLKESAKEIREFILMKSKLDLKDNYDIPGLWLGLDLVSPIFDEYCVICAKEKALLESKKSFI